MDAWQHSHMKMTWSKNGVNLGCAESCKQEIIVLYRKLEYETTKKLLVGEIDLEKTDFLECKIHLWFG